MLGLGEESGLQVLAYLLCSCWKGEENANDINKACRSECEVEGLCGSFMEACLTRGNADAKRTCLHFGHLAAKRKGGEPVVTIFFTE